MLAETMKGRFAREVAKYPGEHRQSAVMACLAIVQHEQGHVSQEAERDVAGYLGMPPIAVREVATFYNMYNQRPVGPSPVLPRDAIMNCLMDFDALAKAGSMLGSAAVIVIDETRDMVECLLRLSYFYMHESCGQCTPCREGCGWLWRIMTRIYGGQGRPGDLDLLQSVAQNMQGRTICALGDSAAIPVRAMLKHFMPEFEARIQRAAGASPRHSATPNAWQQGFWFSWPPSTNWRTTTPSSSALGRGSAA